MTGVEKTKKFVKEHKKELLIGAGSLILGGFVGSRISSSDKALIDNLYDRFGRDKEGGITIVTAINDVIGDANFCDIHRYIPRKTTVRNVGEKLVKYYEKNGIDLDTPIYGLVLFEDRDL